MAIGRSRTGAGFGGLTRYLLTGSDGKHPERVAWVATRNLGDLRPEDVPVRMAEVASRNHRVQKPVYHLSISWHPSDEPTREQMLFAADRVLKDLGLAQHQALIVAHRDTEAPHIHIVVNRVHGRTNRAWHNSNDWPRIEASLRRLEKEQGWRLVPNSRKPPVQAPPRRHAALRQAALEPMKTARTWASLEKQLQERGLYLQPRGRGLVVSDGEHFIKASDVDRSVSRARLEERFGLGYREWKKQVRQVHRFSVRHRNLSARAARSADPRNLRARAQQARRKVQTAERALDGRGDPRVLERELAAFGARFGFTILQRVSPYAATVVWAVRIARRTMDRERTR